MWGKAAILAGVLILAGAGAGYAGLRMYLRSEGFREFLAAQVGKGIGVEGRFAPFRWDGLAVETGGFTGTGEGMVRSVNAERISTEVGFEGIGRGVWEIKTTRIGRLEVDLDLEERAGEARMEDDFKPGRQEKKGGGWVPSKAEVEALRIGELAVTGSSEAGKFSATGLGLDVVATAGRNGYEGEITGGRVNLSGGWLPELRIGRIAGRYRDGSVFVGELDAKVWSTGRISGYGEWDAESGVYSVGGEIREVKCEELLDETWARRLLGTVGSEFEVGNLSGELVGSGTLEVRDGVLTALPVLDSLAAYADTRRFRMLQLSDARTRWRFSDGEIFLNELVLASEGLIRLEGDVRIVGRRIDGRFRLGLVPGTLANIPGAETDVFQAGEHGLLWAPFVLSGTIDDPQEDLTERLVEAAGLRMFEQLPETGERVLKFTRNVMGELPDEVLKKGVEVLGNSEEILEKGGKILGESEKVLKEVGGILDGVLGGFGTRGASPGKKD